MSKFKSTIQNDSDLLTIKMSGDFTGLEAKNQEPQMLTAISQTPAKSVLIDMADVALIDSLGISTLFQCYHKSLDRKLGIKISKPVDYVKKVLHLASVDRIIPIES